MKAVWLSRQVQRLLTRRRRTLLALAGAFALLTVLAGSARLASRLATSIVPRLADNVHVIAYLRHDMDERRARALGALVERVAGVDRVIYVDSKVALERLRADAAAMGGMALLLEGVEEGFLPRSLEIGLAPTAGLAERAAALTSRLRRIDGIAEVDPMEDGTTRLRALLAVLRYLGWGLFALALVAGLAVLVLPLSRGRAARAEEAATLALLGETPRGIRMPWALSGAAAALAGSLLGWLALLGIHAILAAALGGPFPAGAFPRFLPWPELLAALALAVLLGFVLGQRAVPLPRWGRTFAALVLLAAGVSSVWPGPARASDETGRVRAHLGARHETLLRQRTAAVTLARQHAWMAYRLSRRRTLGFFAHPEDRRQRASAFDLSLFVLARSLDETRKLGDELLRVSGERVELVERTTPDLRDVHPAAEVPLPALLWPTAGAIVSKPGVHVDPVTGASLRQDAVQILARLDAPVQAIAAGRVRLVEPLPHGGYAVVVAHEGRLTSVSAGLRRVMVHVGQELAAGDELGLVGRTLDGAPVARVAVYRGARAITLTP